MILYCRSMRTRSLFCLWSFLFSFTDGGESSLRGKEWLHPSVCRHFFSYTSEWKDKQGVLLIIIDCYWLLIGFIGSEPWLWRSIKLTNCLTPCLHFFSSIFVFSFLSNLKNQINHRRYQLITINQVFEWTSNDRGHQSDPARSGVCLSPGVNHRLFSSCLAACGLTMKTCHSASCCWMAEFNTVLTFTFLFSIKGQTVQNTTVIISLHLVLHLVLHRRSGEKTNTDFYYTPSVDQWTHRLLSLPLCHQQIRKLRRELDASQEKVATLTSQLAANVSPCPSLGLLIWWKANSCSCEVKGSLPCAVRQADGLKSHLYLFTAVLLYYHKLSLPDSDDGSNTSTSPPPPTLPPPPRLLAPDQHRRFSSRKYCFSPVSSL